jgi:hypothetical protein
VHATQRHYYQDLINRRNRFDHVPVRARWVLKPQLAD